MTFSSSSSLCVFLPVLAAATSLPLSTPLHIASLHRYAVKGLSGDSLSHVCFREAAETFPDDRRYALLWQDDDNKKCWDPDEPEWLHKQHFLCAFTDPMLMSKYESRYDIVGQAESLHETSFDRGDIRAGNDESATIRRLLTVRERSTQHTRLDKVDLATAAGREELADFFSRQSGRKVVCVTNPNEERHTHQFGNTSSGVKSRGDTRTVHIVNAATVRDVSETLGMQLNPTRFRPNIVLEGLEAWKEFEWVGKKVQCGDQVEMSVISRTVRCEGVSIDPLDLDAGVLDIPKLLTKYYPQHGPYLGVYAVVDAGGSLAIGDGVRPFN